MTDPTSDPYRYYNRWHELARTTPSGKVLFVCMLCGRVAPTPDKDCPEWEQTYEYWTLRNHYDSPDVEVGLKKVSCRAEEEKLNERLSKKERVLLRHVDFRLTTRDEESGWSMRARSCTHCHDFGCTVCVNW